MSAASLEKCSFAETFGDILDDCSEEDTGIVTVLGDFRGLLWEADGSSRYKIQNLRSSGLLFNLQSLIMIHGRTVPGYLNISMTRGSS